MSRHLPRPTAPRPGASADVVEWRRRNLLAAGFPADLASSLAVQTRVDLHELLQLVDRGCPPDLAARILAPVPGEMGP